MVRFEAESLSLDNYAPEDAGFATLIQIPELTETSTATIETFGQTSGTYTIDIVYVDENDGSSTLELFIDGASVGTRTLDDNTGTAAADEENLRTWTLTGIEINNDSEIRLQGSPNRNERVRIDYLEFTVEPTDSDDSSSGETPSTEIIVEAESNAFTLEGYQVEGDVIVLGDAANSGTAFTDFSGTDGIYDVIVGYLDENDGEASLDVSVGDSSLGSFTFGGTSGGPSAETAARLEQTFADVKLSQGDRITFTGTREGNEFARIDYIKFVRIETDDINQAPVADDDSGATATNTPLEIDVLANDADPDSDPLAVSEVDATTTQNGTVEILENGTLRYSPATDFEGQDSFTYTVSDGELTDTAIVTIEVTDDPVRPVAEDDFGTTSQDTPLKINVLANDDDPDGDNKNLTVTSIDTATDQGGTAEIQLDGTVLYRPPSGFLGSDSFSYTVSNVDSLTDTATVSINVKDDSPKPLEKAGNNLFTLKGTDATAKFSIEEPSSTPGGFEFGVYTADNVGLAPGSDGYTTAALRQATTVFSLLGDDDVQLPSLERILSLAANTNYSFFLIKGGTLDSVLNGGEGTVTLGSLLDSNAGGPLRYDYLSDTDSYWLSWDTDRNGVFDLRVDLSFPEDLGIPLGARLQGSPEAELLDFRGLQAVQLSVQVRREAAFNNQVGFYRIENEQGAIRVGNDLLHPGDKGYVEAALRQWVNNPALQSHHGETRTYELTLEGGLWAPFIVVDGTIEHYLDNLRGNDPTAIYFNFIAANPDGADHIRLLGDNVFGFEDLPGGGDNDFDDVILSIKPRINTVTEPSFPSSTLTVADDTFNMTSDQPLTFSLDQLLSNDADSAGNPIALQEFTAPANGTLSRDPDGNFTYISNPVLVVAIVFVIPSTTIKVKRLLPPSISMSHL